VQLKYFIWEMLNYFIRIFLKETTLKWYFKLNINLIYLKKKLKNLSDPRKKTL